MLSQVTRLSTCTSYRWKWIGWVSTPLWVIFQICVPSLPSLMAWTSMSPFGRLVPSMTSVGRRDVRVERDVLPRRGRRYRLEAEVGRHPAELVEGRRVHLVVDRLRFEGDLELRVRALEVVEPELVSTLLVDTGEPVALVGACRVGAVTAGGEGRAVGGVVGGLTDDDRVLALLEDATAVGVVLEGVAQRRQVERGRCRIRR